VKQSVTANTYFSLADKALGLIANIILLPIIIKYLGFETYGVWVLIVSIVNYFLLAQFGVSRSFDKYIAEYAATGGDRLTRMVCTSLYVLLLTAVVITAVALVLSPFIPHWIHKKDFYQYSWLFNLFMVAQAVSLVGQIFLSIPRGFQRFDVQWLISIAGKVVYIVSLVVLLRAAWGIAALLLATVLMQIVIMVCCIVYTVRLIGAGFFLPRNFDFAILKQLYKFGLKVQVTFLTAWVVQNFDKIIIARLIGLQAVAVYDIGAKIVFALREIPYQLAATLVPRVSELDSLNDRPGIVTLYLRSTRYVAMYSFATIALFVPFANPVIQLWIGAAADPLSGYVLQVLLIGSALQLLAAPAQSLTYGIARPGIESIANLIAMVLNIGLSIGLFFVAGFKGIIWGTCIGLLASGVFLFLRTHAVLGIGTSRFIREVMMVPVLLNIVLLPLCWFFSQWSSGQQWFLGPRWGNMFPLAMCGCIITVLSGAMYFSARYCTVAEVINILPFSEPIKRALLVKCKAAMEK
jgi:O-antigen/teichoic acid export membrane protein